MNIKSTIEVSEVAKFSQLSAQWWDKNGPFKTLHDINHVRLEFIESFTPLTNQRVLDVGCGGGILCEPMANKGAQVSGLDADENSIHVAESHASHYSPAINYVCSSIENYEASEFDIITCMEMLEHVNHPELVIQHCARLLRSGGHLFLSTINRSLKAYALSIIAAEYLLGIIPRQTHDYDKFIKPSELAAIARSYGLEVQGLKGISYNPFTREASLHHSVSVNYLLCCTKI